MKTHKKLYWKVSNKIESIYQQLLAFGEPPLAHGKHCGGLLRHRKDDRDRIADMGWFKYKPKFESISQFNGKIFNQNPHNICVFASRKMGRYYQQGINFSAKFGIIYAKRTGRLSGNGWSSLRAENKRGTKIGLVPYEECPDEPEYNWKEYIKTDEYEYNRLIKIASKILIPEYRKITSWNAAIEALEKGYVLFTGIKLHSGDTRPLAPNYILKHDGYHIGGHAINSPGYVKKENILFENPGTYGKNYGKNGMVYLRELFGSNNYDIYIEEFLPIEVRLPLFVKQQEGKLVKTQNDIRCFVIEKGMKRHVSGNDNMKTFILLQDKLGLTYVKKELLNATPEGLPYPLIK